MLSGKTAVITGASTGIGACIAKKYASLGAQIAIIYIGSPEIAENVKNEITEKYGVRAEIYYCDVSDFDRCRETVKKITEDFGGFDILVNNAGITRDSLLVTMEETDFDSVINVNLKGCFNMIKVCGRNFLKRKYGKIINIASVSAMKGLAGQANYASSKAGIIALTKVTARELGSRNICCNAIAPGFIMTDMTKDLGKEDEYLSQIPLNRLGNPEDVAKVAAFLADEASDYVTGEVIRVDGGYAM